MKLLVILENDKAIAGGDYSILKFMEYLSKKGHKITIFATNKWEVFDNLSTSKNLKIRVGYSIPRMFKGTTFINKQLGKMYTRLFIHSFIRKNKFNDTLEISEVELGPLFNETGAKLPKNVDQAIRNAARKQYGYLESTGKRGYYRITNAGINLVKHQLPRVKK